MKSIKFFLLPLSFCFCFLSSCLNDSPHFVNFSPDALAYTTWQGNMVAYDEEGDVYSRADVTIQFIDEHQMYVVQKNESNYYEDLGTFNYQVEGAMLKVTGNGDAGFFIGVYSVLEFTANRLVLETYGAGTYRFVLGRRA